MNEHISVAIDGPSGAGKSTLARLAAKELGYLYVDTGAIYRTVGLWMLRHDIDPKDSACVISSLGSFTIDLGYGEDGVQRMYLDGEDVSQAIRRPEVSSAASVVSAIQEVRTYLMEMQRNLARSHDVIMDGRDIGTVVLPDADVKIFLTASARVRAERRCLELAEKGTPQSLEKVLADILERDERDTARAAAPLRRAEDARLITTDSSDLNENLSTLVTAIKEQLSK